MATATKYVHPKRAKKLPDKLSDCLAVALADLIKCERQRRTYRIDMGAYHEANGHCTVCLAGAAMAGLGVRPNVNCYPCDFVEHNYERLDAISDVALGASFTEVGDREHDLTCAERVDYSRDPKGFKAYIRKQIKALRAKGL